MANLTMSISDELLRRARRVALKKHTSLNALVRDHLKVLADRKEDSVEGLVKDLRSSWKKYGGRTWNKPASREGLHER